MATHEYILTHLCKQLALLAAQPVSCFGNNDTVFIMTFPCDWSWGQCVHSPGLQLTSEKQVKRFGPPYQTGCDAFSRFGAKYLINVELFVAKMHGFNGKNTLWSAFKK